MVKVVGDTGGMVTIFVCLADTSVDTVLLVTSAPVVELDVVRRRLEVKAKLLALILQAHRVVVEVKDNVWQPTSTNA